MLSSLMKSFLSIEHDGLHLLPATLTLLRAECRGSGGFAHALGAESPPTWPPPLNEDAMDYWVPRMEADPGLLPWAKWYVLLATLGQVVPIGVFGFMGKPVARRVEIGYSLVESCHGRGLGTRTIGLMLEWVAGTGFVDIVCAHTLPGLMPSIRVLEKNGFSLVGPGTEPGTILFERNMPHSPP
jgi:ribosomal-protein-alanine N-acetyltransferase